MCQILIQALGIEQERKQTESKRVNRIEEGWYEKNVLPLKNYKLSPYFGLAPHGTEKQQRPSGKLVPSFTEASVLF